MFFVTGASGHFGAKAVATLLARMPAEQIAVSVRSPETANRAVQASSPDKLTFRGGPISAGWNKSAAANVQTSDKASSLPMLEVPGYLESQRLPNAVAVVIALKKTAHRPRARPRCGRGRRRSSNCAPNRTEWKQRPPSGR